MCSIFEPSCQRDPAYQFNLNVSSCIPFPSLPANAPLPSRLSSGLFPNRSLRNGSLRSKSALMRSTFGCNRARSLPGRRSSYTASRICSAVWRSTLTSVETPCSAMVTPKSRFMRAMVMGLWVMMTKRVSVDFAISSIRLQKRSTL